MAKAEREIKGLVEALRSGEDTSEELIEALTPIALRTARRYSIFNPTKEDDIRASSMHGLVQAVRWAPDRLYDNNIEGYVVETCKRFIRDFLEHDHLIPVNRKAMERGADLPSVHSMSRVDNHGESFVDTNLPGHNVQPSESESIEYQEVVGTLSLKDTEFKILALRLKGHTVEEIGRLMGYTGHAYVVRTLKGIASKYKRLVE